MYPDSWELVNEGILISLYNPDQGFGVLQFSLCEVNEPSGIDLISEFEDYLVDRHDDFVFEKHNDFVYCIVKDEDGVWWRYWLFIKGNTLVFATYNCDQHDKGKEDQEVELIIKSVLN